MDCNTPGFPVNHQFSEFTQTHVHWVSDTIQPPHPLSAHLLPSIIPSNRVFSNELVFHIRWPKYRSFSFNINPSNEYSGLISFRMDWLNLLADQGTLKSLLQQYSSRASTLQCSAFFIFQLSHPHMTTGKTTALTRSTFVGKLMSLLFNMLSRMVITFLQWASVFNFMQSPSALILQPPKIKSVTFYNALSSIWHEVMEPDAMIFVFWMLSFKPTFYSINAKKSTWFSIQWRRKWQPTPVFLPGESQGQGSLVASVYGVTQSRTRLKWLSIAYIIAL